MFACAKQLISDVLSPFTAPSMSLVPAPSYVTAPTPLKPRPLRPGMRSMQLTVISFTLSFTCGCGKGLTFSASKVIVHCMDGG